MPAASAPDKGMAVCIPVERGAVDTIRGGRAHLRQALYMPALVAARFNPDLRAKYQALLAAGKPA